jgi:hypothetical protein
MSEVVEVKNQKSCSSSIKLVANEVKKWITNVRQVSEAVDNVSFRIAGNDITKHNKAPNSIRKRPMYMVRRSWCPVRLTFIISLDVRLEIVDP